MQLLTTRTTTRTANRSRLRSEIQPLGLAFALILSLALVSTAGASTIGDRHWNERHDSGSGHRHGDRDRHDRDRDHHENRDHHDYDGDHDGDHEHGGELPGISLADLVSGEQSFDSKNGKLHFADFTATPRGLAPTDLDFYRVIPLADGFRLLTPLAGRANDDAWLDLGYSATTNDEQLVIGSVAASFMGVAFGASNSADIQLRSESGALLGELALRQSGRHGGHDHHDGEHGWEHDDGSGHGNGRHEHDWFCDHGSGGQRHDRTALEESVRRLLIDEQIEIDAGFFGAIWAVNHRFDTHPAPPVPEPSTALLLSLGLLGLGAAGRRPSVLRRR